MKVFAKRLGLFTLVAVLMAGTAWGQTTINFDNAENWTAGSASITSYANDHVYADGLFSATGGPALRNTTSAQDGYPGALGTYAWRLSNVSTVDWRITIASGGVSTFSIDIRRWDSSPSPAFNLEYSINGGTNWTLVSAINNTTLDNSSAWKTFNGTINSANTNILIRLVATGTTERIHVDNFVWSGYVGGTPDPEPSNHVTSFSATSDHESVTLTWSDNDGEQPADGFLVGFTTNAENSFEPVDGTPYANTDGPTDWVRNVAHGVETVTINGLSAETQYYAKIWPYTNSGDDIDYKTDGDVQTATAMTDSEPETPAIFFSEYIEGSSNNKVLEIYNNYNVSVDLSKVSVKLFANGATTATNTWAGSGSLTSQAVYVLANSLSVQTILDQADETASVCNFNGDDAIGLYYDGILIDVIGEIGEQEKWAVAGTSGATENKTLIRKSSIQKGNTDWTSAAGTNTSDSEWIVNEVDYFSDLGQHTGPDTPLPITLASFSAAALNGSVSVTWVTESESENAHFLLYRDGEIIAQIAGAGTSSEPHSYSYTDQYVIPGKIYTYVLADVDYQGKETRHNEVEVKVEAEYVNRDYNIGSAYPNPFNPVTVVPVNLAKDALVTATLYDITGRPLTELHNGALAAGSHALTVNGANLSTGIYFVRININDAMHVQKIALMK